MTSFINCIYLTYPELITDPNVSKGRPLTRNNQWTQFAARSYGVPKTTTDTSTAKSPSSFSIKPSQVKQLVSNQRRYRGRLKRSDSDDNNDIEEIDDSYFKTWGQLVNEIEARMRRDSETEEQGEKVIEERSAAYPHQTFVDGYILSQKS